MKTIKFYTCLACKWCAERENGEEIKGVIYTVSVPSYALTFHFGKGVDKGTDLHVYIYHNENRVHIVYAQLSP